MRGVQIGGHFCHAGYAIILPSATRERTGDKQTVKLSRIVISVALILGVVATASVSASAETYGGGSVASYSADQPIDIGSIVVLTGENSNRVKVATQADVNNMFGVVVDKSQLPFSITNENVENETYVAVSGTYNVLVSNQQGEIASGDYLTLSSVNGIAMRAGEEEVTVFGRANSTFNDSSAALGETELKDSQGGTRTVKFGAIPVTIDIKSNPNHKSTDVNAPEFLKRVGEAIADKEVSPIRIYIGVAIAVISLIAAIAVLYAGIRNGVISIGRNPMSKKSIFRAILEVILTAVLILIIGLFAVYLLLKL